MAVPKKRTSKAKKNSRKANWKRKGDKDDYKRYVKKYFKLLDPLKKITVILMAIYQARPWKKGYSHRRLL